MLLTSVAGQPRFVFLLPYKFRPPSRMLLLPAGELSHAIQRTGATAGAQCRPVKEKGSVRYYSKPGMNNVIRIDYHGAKEVPTGTCHAILKAAGLKKRR